MEVKDNNKEEKENYTSCDVFEWADLFKPKRSRARFPSWPNFPKDVLVEVMMRVSPYEQFSIRAACKNWWAPCPDYELVAINNKVPWMMTWYACCQPDLIFSPQFSLHHPTRDKRPYRINTTIDCNVVRHDVLAIKHGWVLYHRHGSSDYSSISHLYMFSPFTKRIIMLPDLNSDTYWETVATFSSDPTSFNCVFLAHKYTWTSEIVITMCRPHDRSWTIIRKKGRFRENLVGVVCIWPFFYFATNSGSLVKCDVHGCCTFLVRSPTNLAMFEECDHRILEHRGEVILVCLDIASEEVDQCHVFRFIWSKNVWIPQTRIGKRAIFISVTSFLVSEFGASKNMAERVYYLDRGRYLEVLLLERWKKLCMRRRRGL